MHYLKLYFCRFEKYTSSILLQLRVLWRPRVIVIESADSQSINLGFQYSKFLHFKLTKPRRRKWTPHSTSTSTLKSRLPARSLPKSAPEHLDARNRTVQSAARPTHTSVTWTMPLTTAMHVRPPLRPRPPSTFRLHPSTTLSDKSPQRSIPPSRGKTRET